MSAARALIDKLGLAPHPEGGWYRETWRQPAGEGERSAATAIHFLLEADQRSHWHRVDAAEFWLWHGGDRLSLSMAASDAGPAKDVVLGSDILAGEAVQAVVPPNSWQSAAPLPGEHGYVLVSCVVAPGFEFGGFELAAPGWEPGA